MMRLFPIRANLAMMLISAIVFSSQLAVHADEAKAPVLPKPFETPSVSKQPKVIGWPEGKMPTAPPGFEVTAFSREVVSPRWIEVLPNGDVLVAESNSERSRSPNRILLFRDADKDGVPEMREVLLQGLNQPFGMALVGESLYVANTDAMLKFPYKAGQTKIEAPGEKVLDLPAGGYNNHWTRSLKARPDGKALFVTVGSATNVDVEGIDAKDPRRASILEFDIATGKARIFATGLRNPNGMDFAPGTDVLWTAVNERDELGDELVPDYITSVKDGAFYGWPYSYYGQNEDPRQKGKRPDLVQKAIVPDLAVGAHTASLGLAFATGKEFPEKYRGGAFIGQRGSWNRSQLSGYRVAFVPFQNGKPSGPIEDFLAGFIKNQNEVYGRPVGVTFAADGSLLVADELGKRIWRVRATGR